MRTKTSTAGVVICAIALLMQFISCKKEKSIPNHENDTIDSGMVAWYTFDNDILDHSGNNNNVIFNWATPAAGKRGIEKTAYKFDGTISYMKVANSSSLNQPVITLYALVKPEGFYRGKCHGNRIISKGNSNYDQGRINLGFDDGEYYNYTGCDAPVQDNYQNFYGGYGYGFNLVDVRDLSEYVQTNQWYSLVYTYDGANSKLYVNGNMVSNVQGSATFNNNTDPLYIGRNQDPDYPYFFNGIIDEIRIYNRVLSPGEVETLYNKK